MKKFIILSGLVLLCTGCGETPPAASPSPMTSSTASVDPRCMMTPTPSLSITGIVCPGGTTDGSTAISTPVPTVVPTGTPGASSSLPTLSPRPVVTSSDIACLTGRWHQGATELYFQYSQAVPTIPVLVAPGSSIDFNFTRSGNSGTFTQTFNNVVLESSRTSVLSRDGVDNYKFTFNGTASGSFQKNDDGKIYFFDVRPEGATMQMEINGRSALSDPNLTGDMLPVYATEVGVSCSNNMQLTYKIPSRNVTVYLDRL